jgi:RNA polymerase sigma-70 factor (ECF subfamily)
MLAALEKLDYHKQRFRRNALCIGAAVAYVDDKFSSETTSHTQLSVVRRAQANDADAWEALVRTYSRRVYRWCRLDGLQPADAANVVQEVFQSVALKLGDFHRDREGDSFRAWLRRITQNKIHDHFRRQKREVAAASGGTDAYHLLTSHPDKNEAVFANANHNDADSQEPYSDICKRVRDEFSERDWRLFWRIVVDGQPAAEAGAECGISANAARLIKMRVLRRCRQLVAENVS